MDSEFILDAIVGKKTWGDLKLLYLANNQDKE